MENRQTQRSFLIQRQHGMNSYLTLGQQEAMADFSMDKARAAKKGDSGAARKNRVTVTDLLKEPPIEDPLEDMYRRDSAERHFISLEKKGVVFSAREQSALTQYKGDNERRYHQSQQDTSIVEILPAWINERLSESDEAAERSMRFHFTASERTEFRLQKAQAEKRKNADPEETSVVADSITASILLVDFSSLEEEY